MHLESVTFQSIYMKIKPLAILLFCCCLSLQSCWPTGTDDTDAFIDLQPSDYYQPVIMQRSEFETTTTLLTNAEVIINSGKIYVKDTYIFINERNKGFHIINNTDPTNPQNIAFLNVLGSSDLTIKDDAIYVNNATDLLALTIDINSGTIEITKRVTNAFPQIRSPFGSEFYNLQENEIIVDWILNDTSNEPS